MSHSNLPTASGLFITITAPELERDRLRLTQPRATISDPPMNPDFRSYTSSNYTCHHIACSIRILGQEAEETCGWCRHPGVLRLLPFPGCYVLRPLKGNGNKGQGAQSTAPDEHCGWCANVVWFVGGPTPDHSVKTGLALCDETKFRLRNRIAEATENQTWIGEVTGEDPDGVKDRIQKSTAVLDALEDVAWGAIEGVGSEWGGVKL